MAIAGRVVLAGTDDVVHPLLFACETKNPAIVKIALASLQKLIQYKAIPQVSDFRTGGLVASGLWGSGLQEVRVGKERLVICGHRFGEGASECRSCYCSVITSAP